MDATYKLTQVGYPVIVVGMSDKARRFHLLAIFIVSQQQQKHHGEVLQLLRRLFKAVTGTFFRVRYVMGDADAAQWNAVQEELAKDNDLVFLMCYFHVDKKMYEKMRSKLPGMAASVMSDLHELHFSSSEAAFHKKLHEVQERWDKTHDLVTFSAYFTKTWLDHRFWRWQCFHSPGGYATTNNPCKPFNAAIKRDVTLRRKLKVGSLLPRILLLCKSEALLSRVFEVKPTSDARRIRRVRAMTRAGLLSLHSISRSSVSFIWCAQDVAGEDSGDIVRVVSHPSPRIYDDLRKRTVEDLPVSAQLNKLTARMETLGMPVSGWEVDMKTLTCPCPFWSKVASCIHSPFALETRGAVDMFGRATLVNRSVGRARARAGHAGRPRNSGPALAME
ncbi:unnamed protein product [Phytophthora fragariaefolia]|uniref:Unnamed protein product n=1 Tax=Phytophthora fragariaefolia TaxID=1490495 RepID=A0A9W6X015_9STRA|nr:unnamed protein product [Phytophthora fragariaefolia]